MTDRRRLLALEAVTKRFGDTVALSGLSLEVRQGEVLSLLGPSGCGKSTALRLICGLSDPSAGRIRWESPPERGDLSVVFQEPTLMPWATVEANVYLPFRLAGTSRAAVRDRIAETLEMVGLGQFRRSYPRQLSGGMKMRVSIARALVTRPKIVLMDEPFAALDEITRFRLNNDLLRLQAEIGCTVIFVTHSVFESVFLSSRIVVMAARPGRVVRDIDNATDRARDEQFRTSADYAARCREVSAALRDAMGEGA